LEDRGWEWGEGWGMVLGVGRREGEGDGGGEIESGRRGLVRRRGRSAD